MRFYKNIKEAGAPLPPHLIRLCIYKVIFEKLKSGLECYNNIFPISPILTNSFTKH